MGKEIRVDGIENTIKDMLKYTNLFEEGGKKILNQTANEVKKIAKQKVPKDTGLTAKSIKVKTIKGGLGKKVYPAREKGGRGYVANFHEYGTTKMKATPFMTPAEEMAKANFYKKFNELVKEEKKI